MNKEVKKRLLWLSEHKTEDVKEDITYTLDYIRELEREIERLKAIVEGTKENRNELQARIDKAREYIKNNETTFKVNEVVNAFGIPSIEFTIEPWKKDVLEILDKGE